MLLDGPDGNKIDCMFFPCTAKERVLIDESVALNDSDLGGKKSGIDIWP